MLRRIAILLLLLGMYWIVRALQCHCTMDTNSKCNGNGICMTNDTACIAADMYPVCGVVTFKEDDKDAAYACDCSKTATVINLQ